MSSTNVNPLGNVGVSIVPCRYATAYIKSPTAKPAGFVTFVDVVVEARNPLFADERYAIAIH